MGGLTQFDGPRPRVYDFRHTFATECICRWMREGKDVDAIQMHYILMSGIRMLAMALVIMLAAISVTFISARFLSTDRET